MPVLDTNFLIALDSQDEAAIALLHELRAERLLVPDVVAAEYLTPLGARAAEGYQAIARAFTPASTSKEWVLAAAALRQRLRKEKRSIRLADFWIAAWAELEDTFVVTRSEKDFAAMGIKTRAW
ncbi:MAG: hypothetical protein QOE90_2049 [Thermoplasmata archaeon]|jgi:predicted nucleic acid-binding protein|nr:hypothetical protein [Thermoplasmata archaeon]